MPECQLSLSPIKTFLFNYHIAKIRKYVYRIYMIYAKLIKKKHNSSFTYIVKNLLYMFTKLYL